MKIPDKYKGVLMIILSGCCFSMMHICIRLAGDVPTVQKVLFRNLIAMFIAAATLVRSGSGFLPTHMRNLPFLICRASCGVLGMLANFYAVDHLVLADVTMLTKMTPFFAALFSAMILKEKMKGAQIAILLCAFGGSMLIVKPGFTNMVLIPAVIALCGSLVAGVAYTMVRLLSQRGEKSSYIVFFFSAFSCLVLTPVALIGWQPLTTQQALALLATGVCAAGGQFTITAAYRYAPAREISVYDYPQVIFAAFFGFLVFGDVPDALSVLGYVIIIGMAVLNFWYNHRNT